MRRGDINKKKKEKERKEERKEKQTRNVKAGEPVVIHSADPRQWDAELIIRKAVR